VNVRTENLVEKVKQATDGHMVDVVLEAVGKPQAWDDIATILAPRARIAMTGLFAGKKCLDIISHFSGQKRVHCNDQVRWGPSGSYSS